VDARMSILFREEKEEERQQWRGRIVAMPTGLGGLAITPQQQQQQQPSASPAHQPVHPDDSAFASRWRRSVACDSDIGVLMSAQHVAYIVCRGRRHCAANPPAYRPHGSTAQSTCRTFAPSGHLPQTFTVTSSISVLFSFSVLQFLVVVSVR